MKKERKSLFLYMCAWIGLITAIVFIILLPVIIVPEFQFINFLGSECLVLDKTITNITSPAQQGFFVQYRCQLSVSYLVNDDNITSFIYDNRMGNYSPEPPLNFFNSYEIGSQYYCWYNPNFVTQVVFDTSVPSYVIAITVIISIISAISFPLAIYALIIIFKQRKVDRVIAIETLRYNSKKAHLSERQHSFTPSNKISSESSTAQT